MWWALGVVIAALMAWVAYYERENRREFQRMMKQHNIQVREMNGHYRPLENDFVQLESRVETLEEEVRELQQAAMNDQAEAGSGHIVSKWTKEERQSFHRAVCDYYNEWSFNAEEGKRRKMPEGGLSAICEEFGLKYTNMRKLFTRHFMTPEEYEMMKTKHIVPAHFQAVAAGEQVFKSINDPKAFMHWLKHGRVTIVKERE